MRRKCRLFAADSFGVITCTPSSFLWHSVWNANAKEGLFKHCTSSSSVHMTRFSFPPSQIPLAVLRVDDGVQECRGYIDHFFVFTVSPSSCKISSRGHLRTRSPSSLRTSWFGGVGFIRLPTLSMSFTWVLWLSSAPCSCGSPRSSGPFAPLEGKTTCCTTELSILCQGTALLGSPIHCG